MLSDNWDMERTPLRVISREAREHRTVLVDAYEKDGSRETREIEPYSIRPGLTEDRLMFFCLKRNDWRSLLVSNIVRAEATGHSFVPRELIEL